MSTQVLTFNNQELLDHRTIASYQIEGEVTLELTLGPSFSVKVTSPEEEVTILDGVRGKHTIAILKEMYMAAKNLPVERQTLIFGGKKLEDANTVDSYNIQEGLTIHLLVKHGPQWR